ncbi:MAG: uracil-DNA glycosylase [Candidatus Neomarinimicrobiota bacterium]
MESPDKNSFIKQHIELYGEELFLEPSIYSLLKDVSKTSKKSLLSDLEAKLSLGFRIREDDLKISHVFGSGDLNADLVIIGESPKEHEHESGKPFVGPSGKLLDKILKAIGFKRDKNVYLTYILKYKTPENRDPLISEINQFLPFLINQIDIIKPKMIVGLGKVVGRAFLNLDSNFKDMRKNVHYFKSYPLKITYCPEALLRDSSLKKYAWEDFKYIRDFLQN